VRKIGHVLGGANKGTNGGAAFEEAADYMLAAAARGTEYNVILARYRHSLYTLTKTKKVVLKVQVVVMRYIHALSVER
jgi:hypothetical protein